MEFLNEFTLPVVFGICLCIGYTIKKWIADVDGSYGENDFGIFFFTPDGKYVEWTGTYLYSDIPFEVDDPVVKVGG